MVELSNGLLLLGGEKGTLCVLDYTTKSTHFFTISDIGRIKSMKRIGDFVILISTSGIVGGLKEQKIIDSQEEITQIELDLKYESSLRLLSLAVSENKLEWSDKLKKRKKV